MEYQMGTTLEDRVHHLFHAAEQVLKIPRYAQFHLKSTDVSIIYYIHIKNDTRRCYFLLLDLFYK